MRIHTGLKTVSSVFRVAIDNGEALTHCNYPLLALRELKLADSWRRIQHNLDSMKPKRVRSKALSCTD